MYHLYSLSQLVKTISVSTIHLPSVAPVPTYVQISNLLLTFSYYRKSLIRVVRTDAWELQPKVSVHNSVLQHKQGWKELTLGVRTETEPHNTWSFEPDHCSRLYLSKQTAVSLV